MIEWSSTLVFAILGFSQPRAIILRDLNSCTYYGQLRCLELTLSIRALKVFSLKTNEAEIPQFTDLILIGADNFDIPTSLIGGTKPLLPYLPDTKNKIQ